jgi:hypothetical protein
MLWPFIFNSIRGAAKKMQGVPFDTLQITSPVRRLSCVMITVLKIVPEISVAFAELTPRIIAIKTITTARVIVLFFKGPSQSAFSFFDLTQDGGRIDRRFYSLEQIAFHRTILNTGIFLLGYIARY